mmetsp:Transcript_23515/g.29999  ORF Transcript_23515/g.29999 Transcript_23515/m.29999 type:complete len:96 (-) Transcript_23515:159-446(-)
MQASNCFCVKFPGNPFSSTITLGFFKIPSTLIEFRKVFILLRPSPSFSGNNVSGCSMLTALLLRKLELVVPDRMDRMEGVLLCFANKLDESLTLL